MSVCMCVYVNDCSDCDSKEIKYYDLMCLSLCMHACVVYSKQIIYYDLNTYVHVSLSMHGCPPNTILLSKTVTANLRLWNHRPASEPVSILACKISSPLITCDFIFVLVKNKEII